MTFLNTRRGETIPFKVLIALLILLVGVILIASFYKYGATGVISLFYEKVLGVAP